MTDRAYEPANPDPFSQFNPSADKIDYEPSPQAPAPKPVAPQPAADPFANFDTQASKVNYPTDADSTSATGAFVRGAARGILPAVGSFPAIGAGAEAGAAVGTAVGGPIGTMVGGIAGGLAGGLLGSTAISTAQNWAMSQMPDSWREAIGQDDAQQELDEKQHSKASFLGGLLPYTLTMRPGLAPLTKLPENATAIQRIMANPNTARAFGGVVMGGMELGNEAIGDRPVEWSKVAISTGFGVIFNKPYFIGERLENIGASGARRLLGQPESVRAVPQPAAPETQPEPTAESAAQAPEATPAEPRPVKYGVDLFTPPAGEQPITVADADDHGVMGASATKATFFGAHERDPAAVEAAREAKRTEQSIIGPDTQPDVHHVARTMDPQLFEHYEDLKDQQRSYQDWFANHEGQIPPNPAHLVALDKQLTEIEPQIAAAYRRAAEAAGTHVVEPDVAANAEASAAPESVPTTAAQPAAAPADVTTTAPQAPAARTIEQRRDYIRNDVTARLMTAGQPQEEATAAAALIAARYETRAARFGGKLGTAEELYNAEHPEILGPGQRSQQQQAPRAAPKYKNLTALQFIASRGGIKADDPLAGDLRSIFGTSNKFVPGFGAVIRKNGLPLDTMREQMAEAGYFPSHGTPDQAMANTKPSHMLDLLAAEDKGRTEAKPGEQPPAPAREETRADEIERELGGALRDVGIDLATLPENVRARTVELMDKGEVHDAIEAYEKAESELGLFQRAPATDTPEFKEWFGDSKVVDDGGKPLVVYKAMYPYDWTKETATSRGPEIQSINRGTEFPAFNRGEPGIKIAGFFGGVETANRFADVLGHGQSIYPVYLKFEKPLVIDAKGEKAGNIQFGESGKAFRDAVRSGEHDSVIIRNTSDEGDLYVALKPEQIKSAIGNRGTFDPNNPNVLEQRAPALPMDQESRLARAREMGFDTSKVWYHGASRPDRLIEKGALLPKRATSGPMPFFTDNPELASSYSTKKADTSLEEPGDYAGWFKFKPKGARTPVNIDRAWYFLDPETRKTISERAYDIKADDDGNISYEPGQGFPAGSKQTWFDYYLPREGKGNPLATLKEVWLNSGILFNDEAKFMEVLRLAGMKGAEFDQPYRSEPGILPTYIKSENPLNTGNVENLQSLVPELEALASRSRRRAKPGADMWAKEAHTVAEFVDRLKTDIKDGTTYAWTSIPDEITNFLKSKGYDSILDTGGKQGGTVHNVLIPFEPQQVRSVFAKFDQGQAQSPKLLAQEKQEPAPIFYSAVAKAIEEIPQEKAPASQWLATLKNRPGVKAEEMEWLGLDNWLKEQKGPITKQQIADYVRANQIEVKEVTKGPRLQKTLTGFKDINDTKFSQYTLPGGENYRELLLTLPMKEGSFNALTFDQISKRLGYGGWTSSLAPYQKAHVERVYDQQGMKPTELSQRMNDIEGKLRNAGDYDTAELNSLRQEYKDLADITREQPTFKSSHFDEPNILSHIRFNDRVIDGKKTLFIEEIQSDWAQQHRKIKDQLGQAVDRDFDTIAAKMVEAGLIVKECD